MKINALYLYETDDEAKCKAALLKKLDVPKLEAALYQQPSLKAYGLECSAELNKKGGGYVYAVILTHVRISL
ncbi:hypothetical protein CBP31_04550 [Oceanisphaera profunda]|uniref:Uncharacterized protein n=2 Tax=Oceanisphaera profunda TaxID=1416627 RepID=A0A1Y0D462_9GAMM|nr:hypothetical protein CBP31_04550 [Oceanisphaera profunda]